MASVVEVWRYPVKSMAGERLDACAVAETGLEGDRRWALVDGSPNRAGKFLTIREDELMLTYHARMAGDAVEVVTPGGEVVEMDGRLVSQLAAESSRPLTLREQAGANFDDSPVLLVNVATIASFGAEVGMELDRRRFRANLYVDGFAPEEEVEWIGRRVVVGEVELEVVSRCERCVVITRDPDTTAATPELLRALTETHDECLGVYCQVTRPGRVAVGDPVHAV
ncbi:MAG: MOSC domain-containing protein [Candidatus Dormibacteraceae bacterium]